MAVGIAVGATLGRIVGAVGALEGDNVEGALLGDIVDGLNVVGDIVGLDDLVHVPGSSSSVSREHDELICVHE